MASERNSTSSHAFEATPKRGASVSSSGSSSFLGLLRFSASLTRHFLYLSKMLWYFVGLAVLSAIVILHRRKQVGESGSDDEWEAEPGQILNADVYNPFARFTR